MDPALANELAAHAGALRALARQLVGDANADDLVQDTALAALRSPPRDARSLWGWLAQVLQRLASNERRAGARRARREARLPPAPAPEPASRVAERHEAVQRLTTALLALPEPYHGTLLLRFFEAMTPTAIATATGVPLATVKSRLQRGLALLRARLDAGGRDGAGDWRAGLAAAFGMDHAARASAAAVTAASTGAVLMGTATKVGIVTAVAAALVLAVDWNGTARAPGTASGAVSGTADRATAARAAASDAAAPSLADDVSAARVRVAVADVRREATVHGRCVDEHGAALAGVRVELAGNVHDDDARAASTEDHEPPANTKAHVVTGADGAFTFRFWPPPPMQYFVACQAAGRAHVHGRIGAVAAGGVRDLGDLVLPPGTLFRGVVRGRDGAPVPERRIAFASAAVGRSGIVPSAQAQTATGADGTFATVHAVPAGTYAIVVADRKAEPARVAVDGTRTVVELDVVVAPRVHRTPLRGIVVDEAGAPVPRADVGIAGYHAHAGSTPENAVRTDETGAFTLPQAGQAPRAVTVAVHAPGFEPFTSPQPFAWGDDGVRLVLQRAGAIALTVVRADDRAAVEHFQVRLVPASEPTAASGARVRATARHDDGRLLIDDVPRGRWWVVVEPTGDELAFAAFGPVAVDGRVAVPVTVALQRTVARTVRVRTEAGAPVAATRVELGWIAAGEPTNATYARPLDRESWAQRGAALLLDTGVTDGAGELVLRGPAATSLAVFVRGPGHVPEVAPIVHLDEAGPLELTVGTGTTVRGTVTPPQAIVDLRVLANLPASGPVDERRRGVLPGVRLWRADGPTTHFPVEPQPLAADGTFRVDGVPPGRWDVQLTWFEPSAAGILVGASETLASIDALGVPIELALDASGSCTGQLELLVLLDGAPVRDRSVALRRDGDGSSTRAVATGPDGRCRLRARAGTWTLQVLADRTSVPAAGSARVAAGQTTRHTFHATSATLALTVHDADGRPAQGVRIDLMVHGELPLHHVWLPRTRDDGTTTVVVPVLPCVLSVLPADLQDPAAQQRLLAAGHPGDAFARHRLELARVTPQAGATTKLELRLPAGYRR